jgi:beta-mannosidase
MAFRENTRQEAIEQVKRLRDHPSIVLWCGNNEVQTGWESWPDRRRSRQAINADERERIVTGMVNLFGNVLRNVVTRIRRRTCPTGPVAQHRLRRRGQRADDGDYHYWDVWSG